MAIEIENEYVHTILFTGDLVDIANDQDEITYMMGKLFGEHSKWGLKNNINTEHLVVGEGTVDFQI